MRYARSASAFARRPRSLSRSASSMSSSTSARRRRYASRAASSSTGIPASPRCGGELAAVAEPARKRAVLDGHQVEHVELASRLGNSRRR